MNVHEESVGFPSAMFFDCFRGYPIEVHGHGTSSSERMAAHIISSVAQFGKTNSFSCILDSLVDVTLVDVAALSRLVVVKDVAFSRAAMGENVVNSTG